MSTAITDLPAASSLTGSESVPVVQNGVTKRASASMFAVAGIGALVPADIGVTVQGHADNLDAWALLDPTTKQDTLVSGTSIKTVNGTSLLGSGDVAVQETLVSGTNIKTVNSTSLLGSGDVAVQETLVSGTNIKTLNGVSLLGSGDITNGTGDVTGPASSVDGEIALFNGITGKAIKSATTTGLLKATSGVIGAASAGTDYLAPAAIGTTVQAYDVDTAKLDVIQTWAANQTFTETTETTYSLTGTDIDPANGALQYKTISGTTTFTATNFAAGQVVVVALTSGSSHTVNWPTMTWVTSAGNAAPTLTAYDVVVLWKISTTLYGAYVGSGV